MQKRFFQDFFSYSIYVLAILLTFLLVFEPFLEFPHLVSWLGRFHPLILHFPIVLVLVTVVQYWRKDADAPIYLASTTVLTLLSAITGLILSMDGGSKGDLLRTHQWISVAVCALLVIWYYWNQSISRSWLAILQVMLVALIVVTGHFGGMVTHGSDFLSMRSEAKASVKSLTDNPDIYVDIVQPVLDRKCVACHNENKSKGELLLTSHAEIMKGGKSGTILDESKGMYHRISLPLEDEHHMPPTDERQLEKEELTILKGWLELQAKGDLKYSDLADGSELHALVGHMMQKSNYRLWTDLPDISDDKIAEISSEYCTIKRIYLGSNALQVIVFHHKSFSSSEIQKLEALAKNTVELNLSNLPLGSQDFEIVSNFQNLEHLDLSGCEINDEDFMKLGKLNRLKTLKIYNTSIGDASINAISAMPELSSLYVYNAEISAEGLNNLTKDNASLNIIDYAPEALDFKSVLPSPAPDPVRYFFREAFYLKLEHPLDNIDVRFTLDGSEPDRNSMIVRDSMLIEKEMTLKFFASKEGWESSSMDSIQFMRSDHMPVSYELKYPADKKYLGIGKALLFDLNKGPVNFGDDSWMAFKEDPLSLFCEFDDEIALKEVILSSIVHTDPYIFPPSAIKVYGGSEADKLSLVGTLTPKGLKERKNRHFRFYNTTLNARPIKFLRIEVLPLKRIPQWHQGKGEKGWFFIDEVVFVAN